MATNIIQNGVTFNYDNTKGVGASLGGVYTHQNNKENGKYYYDEDTPKVLMALDIDWNGATWPEDPVETVPSSINTTGELIKAIKYASTHGGGANYSGGDLINITGTTISHAIPPISGDAGTQHGDPDGDNGEITLLASITKDQYGHIINVQTITITQLKSLLGLLKFLINQSGKTYNSIILTAYINDETGEGSLANDTKWEYYHDDNDNSIVALDANDDQYDFKHPSYSHMLTIQRDFEHDTSSYSEDVNSYYFSVLDTSWEFIDNLSIDSNEPTNINNGDIIYCVPDSGMDFNLNILQNWEQRTITVTASNTHMPSLSEEQSEIEFPSYTNNIANIDNYEIVDAYLSENVSDVIVTPLNFDLNGVSTPSIEIVNSYTGNTDLLVSLIVRVQWEINDFGYTTYAKDFTYHIKLKGTPTVYPVEGISLNKSDLSVAANGTGTIIATITPNNATNKGVNWQSSDETTATVTASTTSGNAATVTWKKAGTVTITATAAGDTSKTAQCTVICDDQTVYYYSVGTDEVTASNYTTANNVQSVTSLSSIPSSLDISTLMGPVYILLPSGKTPTIIPNSGSGSVALTQLTPVVDGHSYWKSARFATGATMIIS